MKELHKTAITSRNIHFWPYMQLKISQNAKKMIKVLTFCKAVRIYKVLFNRFGKREIAATLSFCNTTMEYFMNGAL